MGLAVNSLIDGISLVEVLAISFALGCDAFAVGLGLGTTSLDRRAAFRLWFHFGLFQFLMPLFGWYLGNTFSGLVGGYAVWPAFFLLCAISAKMLHDGLEPCSEKPGRGYDPTRGLSLVGLSVATSMDAFAVGVGIGMAAGSIVQPAAIIGIVAALMTYTGIGMGYRLSVCFGKRMEVAGGLVLFAIALKLVA